MLDVPRPAGRSPQLQLPHRLMRRIARIRLGVQTRLVLRALWLALLVGLLVLHGEPAPRPYAGPASKPAIPPTDVPLNAP